MLDVWGHLGRFLAHVKSTPRLGLLSQCSGPCSARGVAGGGGGIQMWRSTVAPSSTVKTKTMSQSENVTGLI